MNDLSTIWRRPPYLPYVQAPLTATMVSEAEAQLGHKLPTELIEILQIQNGGYLRKINQSTPSTMIMGIGPHRPSMTTIIRDQKDLIPIDTDAHWNLCLDYRLDQKNPCITFIEQTGHKKKIAENFKDYLSSLELITYDKYALESDIAPSIMIPKIEAILNIKFSPLNKWADGIPTQKAKYKDSWISIHTNMVPNSFVRKTDKRYSELKPKVTEYMKLYDELKENTYLLKIFEKDAEQEAVQKLKHAGLDLHRVSSLIAARSQYPK